MEAPYNKGSETSRAAAVALTGIASSLKEKVYVALLRAGSTGLTCEQVEGVLRLSHQSASARINALKREGRVLDSGKQRRNRTGRLATIYVVAGGDVEPDTTRDWKRVTLARIIKEFGGQGFQITLENGVWTLRTPVAAQQFGSFPEVVKAIGEIVR